MASLALPTDRHRGVRSGHWPLVSTIQAKNSASHIRSWSECFRRVLGKHLDLYIAYNIRMNVHCFPCTGSPQSGVIHRENPFSLLSLLLGDDTCGKTCNRWYHCHFITFLSLGDLRVHVPRSSPSIRYLSLPGISRSKSQNHHTSSQADKIQGHKVSAAYDTSTSRLTEE